MPMLYKIEQYYEVKGVILQDDEIKIKNELRREQWRLQDFFIVSYLFTQVKWSTDKNKKCIWVHKHEEYY